VITITSPLGTSSTTRSLSDSAQRLDGLVLAPVRERQVHKLIAITLVVIVLPAAVVGVVAGMAVASSSRTVSCREVILNVKFPEKSGYRLVLGVVSAPPAYMGQVAPSGKRTWPYFRKAGLVVTGRDAITVSVPKKWRNRLAITWGARPDFYNSLRMAGCPPTQGLRRGRAYAGGFFLKSRSACVPLVFRVQRRSATVQFGLGRACPVTRQGPS
jgi:hypothetical protein